MFWNLKSFLSRRHHTRSRFTIKDFFPLLHNQRTISGCTITRESFLDLHSQTVLLLVALIWEQWKNHKQRQHPHLELIIIRLAAALPGNLLLRNMADLNQNIFRHLTDIIFLNLL